MPPAALPVDAKHSRALCRRPVVEGAKPPPAHVGNTEPPAADNVGSPESAEVAEPDGSYKPHYGLL